MFGSFKRLAQAFHIPTDYEREMAYLNGAKDRSDLEYRMRRVERGELRRNY